MNTTVQIKRVGELAGEEICRRNEVLELRLAERTAEVRALRAKMEEFAYTVAHDLRGPLMSIGGFSELLRDHSGEVLDEKSRHYLRSIIAAADRLELLLASIVARKKEESKAPFDYAKALLEYPPE